MELDALDIAAFLVIVLALAGTVAIILTLGALPYQVARSRSHPHADAIRVAGWLGLFLGGLPWLLVLLWSLLPPHGAADDPDALARRVAALEEEIRALRARGDAQS